MVYSSYIDGYNVNIYKYGDNDNVLTRKWVLPLVGYEFVSANDPCVWVPELIDTMYEMEAEPSDYLPSIQYLPSLNFAVYATYLSLCVADNKQHYGECHQFMSLLAAIFDDTKVMQRKTSVVKNAGTCITHEYVLYGTGYYLMSYGIYADKREIHREWFPVPLFEHLDNTVLLGAEFPKDAGIFDNTDLPHNTLLYCEEVVGMYQKMDIVAKTLAGFELVLPPIR